MSGHIPKRGQVPSPHRFPGETNVDAIARLAGERDAARQDVDRLRAELADCRAAGDALADAAANLIVECARRTVAHQAVHTRDLTGWTPLEREVKAWQSGR